jgi:hypothetical protein
LKATFATSGIDTFLLKITTFYICCRADICQ